MREIIKRANGLFLDFFDAFLGPLELELAGESSHTQGRAHGMADIGAYTLRINATNFALANDDGAITRDYDRADLILVGVSRSGKTPTCLYMALQYGIFAANFPFAEEEFETGAVAGSLCDPRAQAVRTDDRAGTPATDPQRAAPEQQATPRRRRCEYEVRAAEAIFRSLRHSMHQHDRMFHRGDRESHSRPHRRRTPCAPVKILHVEA